MIQEEFTELHILKEIQMDEIEKTEIRDTLVRFMASHPLPQKRSSAWFVRAQHKILSPYGNNLSRTMSRFGVGALLLVIICGGSLTYASASALPGDLLYPIKINIKENIEASLQTEPEEKLAWQEKRVERRLNEIKDLKVKKDLSPKDVLIAKTVLKEHVADLKNTLAELKETGKEDVILATGAKLLPQSEEALDKEIKEDISITAKEVTSEENKDEEKIKKDPEALKETTPEESTVEKAILPKEESIQTKLKNDLTGEVKKQLIEIQLTVKDASGEGEKPKKEEKIEEPRKPVEPTIKIESEIAPKELLKTKKR